MASRNTCCKSLKESIIRKVKAGPCVIDNHTHVGVDYKSYVDFGYPYCLSFEDLVVRMKHLGIDYSVVLPFGGSSYYRLRPSDPSKVETCTDFSAFPYEIENRNLFTEIYDVFPEYAEMALPFVIFDPSRKAQEQVGLFEELQDRRPLFGLKTCTTYIQSFVKDIETVGRPILDFACRHGLPLLFHSSYDKADPWASAYDIVEFAEHHPEVRVCIAHTARFIRAVLDRAAALPNCFVDVSAFDIHCLLARREHRAIPPCGERFAADYNDPPTVLRKLADEYPDTLIWGTDTPGNYYMRKYYDGNGMLVDVSLKSSFDTETRILRSLPAAEIERITWRNTVRFLCG
jgi:predicted TIM-barrel fold metal-dependent hydrolase